MDPIPELKRQLGAELAKLLERWRTTDACEWLGIDQPRVSELRRQKLDRFSLQMLMRFADRLGYIVSIRLTKRTFERRGRGSLR